MALIAPVFLTAGCGAGEHPLEPEARIDEPDATAVAATGLSARQATSVQFGDFALYVPGNVSHVRGILLALGGPDTRGFAAGTPFGAPFPEVEAALQALGSMFRDLAAERGLAILGSGRFAEAFYPNEPASDQLLLEGIAQAATLTGRTDLLDAPILMYGMAGGAPEAAGFTRRHPGRVSGLFMKVPFGLTPMGPAPGVPTYVVLAEFEIFVDNAAVSAIFEAQRTAGAPWALALERGVPHYSLSPAQRELTVDWMKAILPFQTTGARPVQAGWLGDPATGQVAPFRTFAGDPSTASWFPTRPLAEQWAAFIVN